MDDIRLTRRGSLASLFAGALALAGWKVGASEAGTGPAAVASGAVTCVNGRAHLVDGCLSARYGP